MSIVISLAPGGRGECVAHLGRLLGRTTGVDLVVVAVTPAPWPPNPYGIDDEFAALQQTAAQEALDRAREIIGPEVAAEYLVEPARSVTAGVLEVSRRRTATLVVVGSSGTGLVSQVSLGGVANRLLNSLEVPVCFAPKGFTAPPDASIERITVGFGRGDRDSDLLRVQAAQTERLQIGLRVVCFAVRPSTELRGTISTDPEDLVVGEWADSVRRDIGLTLVADGIDPKVVEIVVVEGGSWREVVAGVDWGLGDVLAIGASTSPISRFFLGSHASKIVRNAPVPVIIVGRSPGSTGGG